MYTSSQILIEHPPRLIRGDLTDLVDDQPQTLNSWLPDLSRGPSYLSTGIMLSLSTSSPRVVPLCILLTFSRTWPSVMSQSVSQPRYHSLRQTLSSTHLFSSYLLNIYHMPGSGISTSERTVYTIGRVLVLIKKTGIGKKSLCWVITIYSIV